MAKFTAWITKKKLKRADFRQGDTRDQDGNLVWMSTIRDALALVEDIKNNYEFQRAISSFANVNSLDLFLGKQLMCNDLMTTDAFLLLKFIFFVRCIEQQESLNNTGRIDEQDIFLFMQERPWFAEIAKFVKSRGIKVVSTGNVYLYFKIFVLKCDPLIIMMKDLCKKAAFYMMAVRYTLRERLLPNRSYRIGTDSGVFQSGGKGFDNDQPRIAVEHYGYLNFDSPEMFSDLFFLQKSSSYSNNILIYFGLPKAPIGDEKLDEIWKRGMAAIVTNPLASATPRAPLFNHRRRRSVPVPFDYPDKKKADGSSGQWLQRHVSDYLKRCNYWADFFTQHNVKIHVTWFKYSPDHCAILDALKSTGGAGVICERSCDYFLAPWTFTTADVVFGFSKWGAHLERDKSSRIPYYVLTGYLGDYRFALLQEQADQIRDRIKSRGAKRIIAYFDEHARNHPRWNLAYSVTLEHYSYLLTKVLENPWFGLILKPKVPSSLRSRLGSVSELLHRAEKTGRCYVFEDGTVQGSYPPAAASLGADIAIHGHLFAATAGVESALAGVPTLFMDCEGVSESPLRILGDGKVIFKDMEHLWLTCVNHWNRPKGIPGFGDWSQILDELDPFRDGRAAERMGTYLEWLTEGFKAGLPKETVLADAAERYAKLWGRDKILSVNAPTNIKDFSKSCLV